MEKHPHWTLDVISNTPDVQLVAVFGSKEDSFSSWADALPGINEARAAKGLGPLKLVGKVLTAA